MADGRTTATVWQLFADVLFTLKSRLTDKNFVSVLCDQIVRHLVY
jgi:hypothetical protein